MGASTTIGRIGRRRLLAAGLLAAPGIVHAQGANGVALVIGNSKYKWEASLPNVKRDAPDVARRFQALGLKTELLENLGRDALLAALEKFKEASRGANFAAFYFAGHGASWEKETYIVPVDADLNDPKTAQSLIPATSVIAATKDAAHRLLVFDSCRNNPADGWRQKAAKVQARSDAADKVATEAGAANTLVLLSTAPGGVALDGPAGENSPFAASFLRQLDAASIDLQALPGALRRDLLIATECRQMIWEQNTFDAPFLLKGLGKTAARPDPPGLLELPNAYAAAKQIGFMLPAGLISLRPSNGSSDAPKIGSYRHDDLVSSGRTLTANVALIQPSLLVVMSLGSGKSAEMVIASKDWNNGFGARWRFVTGNVSGNTVEYDSVDGFYNVKYTWRDQNSGSVQNWPNGQGYSAMVKTVPRSFSFTRLDG